MLYADLGYRGVDKDNPDIDIKYRGKDKRLTDEEHRLLKDGKQLSQLSTP